MSSLAQNLRRQRALVALALCFAIAGGVAAAMLLNGSAPSAEAPVPATVDRVAPCTYRPQIRLTSMRMLPVVRTGERTDAGTYRTPVCADSVPVVRAA